MSWAEVRKINGDMTTALDVTLGKREDAAAASVNTTNTALAYLKGIFGNTAAAGAAQFTANGTFTVPANAGVIYITAISAGGNGGPGYRQYGGGGGSCGNFVIRAPFFVTPAQQLAVTVGTGNTVIGSLLTLVKGSAGGAASSAAVGTGAKNQTASGDYGAGGPGGSRSASPVTFAGPGTRGACLDGVSLYGSPGGAALVPATTGGGGGGGGVPLIFVKPGTTGAGGDCTVYDAAAGNAGGSYGAGGAGGPGGSAAAAAIPGGAGGPGYVLIEW
ncbi:MAG: hypothetical protein FWC55_08795 [Firmicutes bacterium]|nr:hypothetical protein [Bacillota bacterium]